MSVPLWVHELAARFWTLAGGEPQTLPRDVRLPIARAFPITRVALPALRVDAVDAWLRRVGVPCALNTADRPLRACLVATTGSAAVFLDRDDPTAEQRFSLAHELAHFLHDYWSPRQRAAETFGSGVLEVLDGKRPPRPEERIQALLATVPIGLQVHLMERAADGSIVSEQIGRAESDADLLACELLAPENAVRADLDRVLADDKRGEAEQILIERYGLPGQIGRWYAQVLVPAETEPSLFLRRLRLVR